MSCSPLTSPILCLTPPSTTYGISSPRLSPVSPWLQVSGVLFDVTMLRGPSQLEHLKCLGCEHPWISHEALEILEEDCLYLHQRRGFPDLQCGGFYPQEPVVSASYGFCKSFSSPDMCA